MGNQKLCELCGEPMPDGEEMFKFHGYSGPCSKPPLPRSQKRTVEELERELSAAQAEIARCHARLEIDHVFVSEGAGGLKRQEVPMAERHSVPDGITCRDETIGLLDEVNEVNEELRAKLARYEAAEKGLPGAPQRYGLDPDYALVHSRDYDTLRATCIKAIAERDANAKDAIMLDWIEDNCRMTGGGTGMTVTFFVPDAEYVRGGIQAAIDSAIGKEG